MEALPTSEKWISDNNPNVKRAVIEGLRIWTSRPYFKDNPENAIKLIAKFRSDDNEYLRKSIGNSLRDMSKNHKKLVDQKISTWDSADKNIIFIQKLIYK